MRAALPNSGHILRSLFDALLELDPDQREACIAALGLPTDARLKLQVMLAFDHASTCAPRHRDERIARLDLPKAVRDRLRKSWLNDVRIAGDTETRVGMAKFFRGCWSLRRRG